MPANRRGHFCLQVIGPFGLLLGYSQDTGMSWKANHVGHPPKCTHLCLGVPLGFQKSPAPGCTDTPSSPRGPPFTLRSPLPCSVILASTVLSVGKVKARYVCSLFLLPALTTQFPLAIKQGRDRPRWPSGIQIYSKDKMKPEVALSMNTEALGHVLVLDGSQELWDWDLREKTLGKTQVLGKGICNACSIYFPEWAAAMGLGFRHPAWSNPAEQNLPQSLLRGSGPPCV